VTWTDAVVVLLALIMLAGVWELIGLRRRLTRTEIDLAKVRNHVRRLDVEMETVWVSPHHQLPHIKDLEIKR